MANEPPTGLLFHSKLSTPEMSLRLRGKMPDFDWRLGDSDQYRHYYVVGRRTDGLQIKITPEDAPDEYYLGVYFSWMAALPTPERQLATAQQIHQEVLPVVEGARKA
jgi:hypothetical protein